MLYFVAFIGGYATTLTVLYIIDIRYPGVLNRWMRVEERVIELLDKELAFVSGYAVTLTVIYCVDLCHSEEEGRA